MLSTLSYIILTSIQRLPQILVLPSLLSTKNMGLLVFSPPELSSCLSIVKMLKFYRLDKIIKINSYLLFFDLSSQRGAFVFAPFPLSFFHIPTASTIISNIAKYQSSLPIKDSKTASHNNLTTAAIHILHIPNLFLLLLLPSSANIVSTPHISSLIVFATNNTILLQTLLTIFFTFYI